MTLKRPLTRNQYISSLKLAPTHPAAEELLAAPVPQKEGEPSADVVGGSAMSFVSDLPAQARTDVLNSTLLAQLAANYAADREKDTEAWYAKYREVLENIGWALQNFGFSRYESSAASFQMDKVALEILAALAAGPGAAVLTAAIDALGKLDPDSRALTIFDSNGSSGEAGNFQLGTASQDPGGNVSMALGTFYFEASEHKTRFLFWSWSSKEVNFYSSAQRVVLNEVIYATVRSAVVDKLGDRAQKYVADLPIGD